jgi:hypothetical protein
MWPHLDMNTSTVQRTLRLWTFIQVYLKRHTQVGRSFLRALDSRKILALGRAKNNQEAARNTQEKDFDYSSGTPDGAASWGRMSISLRNALPITDCLRVKVNAKLLHPLVSRARHDSGIVRGKASLYSTEHIHRH